jgi:predicted N-acetyltransferase YhbS
VAWWGRQDVEQKALLVVILTRLGVGRSAQGAGLGRALVAAALGRIATAAEVIGVRAVLLLMMKDLRRALGS